MLEPISREEVLRAIKRYGPLQPLEIRRKLGKGDTTLIGATLSELAYNGKVAITNLKRGSSPFYYDPGNIASLERVAQYLGEKDKRTYDRLKAQKVIRADSVDPLTRVSLAQIKDYSRPFKFSPEPGSDELLFFHYFLVTQEEAERLIKERLGLIEKREENEKKKEKQEERAAPQEAPAAPEPEPTTIDPATKPASASASTSAPASASAPTPAPQPAPKKRSRMQKPRSASKPKPAPKLKRAPKPRMAPKSEKQTRLSTKTAAAPEAKPAALPRPRIKALKAEKVKNQVETEDDFLKRVVRYCNHKGITVIEANVVRKGQELDLVLAMPTPLGGVDYYCKAKSKKKSNHGDVAAALLAGQQRRLPAIYLTTGEVTKKAKEMTETQLKGVTIKEIKP